MGSSYTPRGGANYSTMARGAGAASNDSRHPALTEQPAPAPAAPAKEPPTRSVMVQQDDGSYQPTQIPTSMYYGAGGKSEDPDNTIKWTKDEYEQRKKTHDSYSQYWGNFLSQYEGLPDDWSKYSGSVMSPAASKPVQAVSNARFGTGDAPAASPMGAPWYVPGSPAGLLGPPPSNLV